MRDKSQLYRPCVVGVFIDDQNKCLVCERSDVKGAWQFPQGGIEKGEAPEDALQREMLEEIGTDQFSIIKKLGSPISYDFPKGVSLKKYVGQSQFWFLLKFTKNAGPNLGKGDGEFVAADWRTPQAIVNGMIEWKKDSYLKGLTALGVHEVE